MESVITKTTMKHVDGMVVTVVASMRDLIVARKCLTYASALILKQMSVKLRMEIHVKCHLRIKVYLTIGVPELTAVQIGVTTILPVKNGAIVT